MIDSTKTPLIKNSFSIVAVLTRFPLITAGVSYLVLVCLAFSPLTLNFSSAIPGIPGRQGDYSIFYWNIWWFQHAIFGLGQDPFFTNYIFYPHTLNLAYHMFTPFLDVAALPIYAVFGSVIAINSLMFGSLVFSGLAMFAYLRHHGVQLSLAYIGGLLFTFNSFATAHVSMSQLDMLPMGWLPLAFLAWDWLAERRRWIFALVLSGVLYAAFMTDFQFGLWLVIMLPSYILYSLLKSQRQVRLKIVLLGGLGAVLLLGLLMIAPLPQWLAGRRANYPPISLEAAEVEGYITPAALIDFPQRFIEGDGAVTLGIILPLLVVAGLIRNRRVSRCWLWLLGGVGFVVLAFGPTLHPAEIPMPYRLLHVALGGMYRAPARFMLPAIFALVVFAIITLRSDYRRFGWLARVASVIGLIVWLGVENRWLEPLPTFNLPDYRIYHTIGADPDQYFVLEVPVGPYNNVTEEFGHGAQLQYYAAIHHKQLINGQVSRAPSGTTKDYRQWKLITALAEERPVPDLTTARNEFQQLSHEWDIRYVIIHREMIAPDLANWASEFFNTEPDWCLVDEEGPVLAYHRLDGNTCPQANLLDPSPDGMINIGDGHDDRYLGLGWYLGENIGGPQARWTGLQPTSNLRVHLSARSYRVTIQATAFVPTETVSVSMNGTQLSNLSIGNVGWGQYPFNLPASAIPADGLVTLTFTSARSQSAFEQTGGQVDDKRLLAVAYDSIGFAALP